MPARWPIRCEQLSIRATAPESTAAAMEEPLISEGVGAALEVSMLSEGISIPGTSSPPAASGLARGPGVPSRSTALADNTPGMLAGNSGADPSVSPPAATTTTPAASATPIAEAIAGSSRGVPRLRLMTVAPFVSAHRIPAATSAGCGTCPALATRAISRLARGATPQTPRSPAAAAAAATPVPWPRSSADPSPTRSTDFTTRRPSSGSREASNPLSMKAIVSPSPRESDHAPSTPMAVSCHAVVGWLAACPAPEAQDRHTTTAVPSSSARLTGIPTGTSSRWPEGLEPTEDSHRNRDHDPQQQTTRRDRKPTRLPSR